MAHEIEVIDGVGSVFSVRETMWHRLGHVISTAPSLHEGMRLARHLYTVEVEPLYRRRLVSGGTDEVYDLVSGANVTVRTDTGAVLGTVGDRYTVLQNQQAFGVLEPLLDGGVAHLETGGTLRDGRDVWMLVRFDVSHPVVQEVFTDLGVRPYGLIANNHSGQRGVVLKNTPVRVVCANTLAMALGQGDGTMTVRHTGDVAAKTVDAARTLWRGIVERMVGAARQYDFLRGQYLDEAMFQRLVLDTLAPLPKMPKRPTARQTGALDRIKARRIRLVQLRTEGDGHKGDGSAWEAFGAVTQSLDHDVTLWRTRTERLESLAFGSIAQLKGRVLRNLLAPSKAGAR
jgi:phage/plasmid-like protein (TIGR03299 family)